MDSIPQKHCSECDNTLPATSEFFHRNSKKKDGFCSLCKVCRNKKAQIYNARPEIRERNHAYHKIYASRPGVKEHRKDLRERPARRAQRNAYRRVNRKRSEVKALRRIYRQRSEVKEREHNYAKEYRRRPNVREHVYIKQKEYHSRPEVRERERIQDRERSHKSKRRAQKREGGRIYSMNRRARQKTFSGQYTLQQIQEQLKRQRYRCYYAACGHSKFKRIKGKYIYHIDHTFPLSRVVGTDIPANDMSYLVLACPSCNTKKSDKFPWEWIEGGRLL